jgi:hypothetical protein
MVEHHGTEIGRRHARKHLAAAIDAAGESAGASVAEIKSLRLQVLTAESPRETLASLNAAYAALQERQATNSLATGATSLREAA